MIATFGRFLLVGIINTIVGLAITLFLYHSCESATGVRRQSEMGVVSSSVIS